MRYAAYVRISSEEQVGNYSLKAQKRAITAWVQAQGGTLVKTYTDEALSGRTTNRSSFQQMRKDARAGKFDALVVHKFDRFARNRTDAYGYQVPVAPRLRRQSFLCIGTIRGQRRPNRCAD